MSTSRGIISVSRSTPTMEGAGVRLRRAFGQADSRLDPFLLLDDFGSEDAQDYIAGFPWHPHRGIETITYLLSGEVQHGDSLGNKGTIGPGDLQWMTAGSGIIHEEMPRQSKRLRGFQLWANLPASHKMMAPRYQEVRADEIPLVELAQGVEAKVICGHAGGVTGRVLDIVTEPQYLDVTMSPGTSLQLPVPSDHNLFAYTIEGVGVFSPDGELTSAQRLVVFGEGDELLVKTEEVAHFRFLLVSGKPIGEPVAWGGPIVMNTQAELKTAFLEYEEGSFIKDH